MSESYDELIDGALGDFRAREATAARPVPGVAAVRARVAHRRKVRTGAVSVLGALLVAVPVAAIAAGPHRGTPPTPAGSVTPGPVDPASPTASPPTASPTAPAPDGRVTMAQLTSTPVDIPSFGDAACATGHVRLASTDNGAPWVVKLVNTNLDDDPALETAALVYCRLGQSPLNQVVAFEREPSGAIRTLGRVAGQRDDLNITGIAARTEGGVTAEVVDIFLCCGSLPEQQHRQHRDYAWQDGRFRQVGGPTVWGDPGRVTDLQVVVADVTLTAAADGRRTGSITVTVKNNGPNPSGRFMVHLTSCSFDCSAIPDRDWVSNGAQAFHAPLAAGQRASLTIDVSFDAGTPGGTVEAWLRVRGVNDSRSLTDVKPDNNSVTFRIRPS
jgi:hypothetical protein